MRNRSWSVEMPERSTSTWMMLESMPLTAAESFVEHEVTASGKRLGLRKASLLAHEKARETESRAHWGTRILAVSYCQACDGSDMWALR